MTSRAAERLPPVALLLALHALVWTLAAWLARGNLDLPGDMVENYVWGIEWQAGYAKHPPLFAWVTAAWFSVFPRTDIAYFALAAVNAAAGLAGVAMLARRFLPRDEATVATLVLAVSPLYTALAIKFNANAVLLSTWAWAAYGYVALMQGGRLRHAVVCGVFTALAVLGKYFTVVLVAAFALATLARPAWRARLRGLGPWLAIAVGASVLAPHALWQVENDFATFGYAAERGSGSLGAALLRFAKYSVAQALYLLPSLALLALLAPRGQRLAAPRTALASIGRPGRQADLWWLAFAPLLAAAAIAAVGRTEMASVWGMAQWYAVTVLWLAAVRAQGIAFEARRTRQVLAGYWVLVLALSAAAGWQDARKARPLGAEPRAELAASARAVWRAHTGQPLRIVGGSHAESASVVFYGDDAVHWWHPGLPKLTPWITPERLARDGALVVCRDDDTACQALAAQVAPDAALSVSPHKHAWGRELPPVTYRLYLRRPRAALTGTSTPG